MKEAPRPHGVVSIDEKGSDMNPVTRLAYPVGLYTQALSLIPGVADPNVHAELSWTMDKYWRRRGSPNSLLTLQGLGKLYQVLTPLYPALNKPGEEKLGKQQPSLVESTNGTLKRLRFIYGYVKSLRDPCISVISGGSMSYGRFYNVREGVDPSDLDLMVVFNDGEESQLNADNVLPESLGFDKEDARLLRERMKVFAALMKEGKVDVLSHKAPVEKLGIAVSMHIMPSSVFESMMVYNPHNDLTAGGDVDRRLRDYKPQPFKHQSVRLNNFRGEPLLFGVNEEFLHEGVSGDEVITRIPSHAIVDGQFVPGLYHNLLSPRFEMEAFSAQQCVASATLFWSLMRKLEKQYRTTDPTASALKSHIRYEIFNPMLIKDHESRR